ncbi:MAG: hypothetical protein ACRCTP_06285 [Aeromonas popoffii]|uniref:hypothetical protein n=1 Tax=Aeromonas popoffii TaxID=70856 RepID=UPI003F3C1875
MAKKKKKKQNNNNKYSCKQRYGVKHLQRNEHPKHSKNGTTQQMRKAQKARNTEPEPEAKQMQSRTTAVRSNNSKDGKNITRVENQTGREERVKGNTKGNLNK